MFFQAVIKGKEGGHTCCFSLLLKKLPLGFFLAYVPMGPCTERVYTEGLESLLTGISISLRDELPKKTIFIRFDPPWINTAFPNRRALQKPLYRAISDIQPPDTVILDLEGDSESLLAAMKPKWRYNIRLAEKKGVTIHRISANDILSIGIDTFWELYRKTAERDGIAIHSKDYYKGLFKKALEHGTDVRLYIARHENQPLASIIVLFFGNQATYLYGASSNEKRNLMPAYLLQWEAICDAKAVSMHSYDFYGIPPTDDPGHPMSGLYRFKTGFGGTCVHREGSIDFACVPFAYRVYRLAEKARNVWYKRVKKIFKRENPRIS